MSDNVGLSTPRGSGTSGYVQRNRAFIRPRDNAYGGPHGNSNPRDLLAAQQASRLRQPDQGILEHDRKRAIEVQVFALRDELEEEGKLDEDAIDERCDELRKKLTEEQSRGSNIGGNNNNGNGNRQRFKSHQVHEQARAKIVESERLRRALRINKDYQEGGHWRRQEEKQQKRKVEEESGPASAPTDRGSNDKRRRRYSDDSVDSREDGQAGRSGRRASPPLKSVEDDSTERRAPRDSGRDSGRDKPSRRDDYSDLSEGEVTDDSRAGRGRNSGPSARPGSSRGRPPPRNDSRSRSPRSASRSPSRSPSRSLSRSRSRSRSYDSRSPSRSRSPVRRRSRSDSRD